jgi:hypothetical protein
MKRFLLALLSSFALAVPAFAIVGGPWDGNIPGNPNPVNPSDVNGTYQGTIKGKNLAGVMRFSSTDSGQVIISSTTTRVDWAPDRLHYTTVDVVTTKTLSATGFATFFFEGKSGQATLDTAIDLGGRKLAGVINGAASRSLPVTLERPFDGFQWTLTDNAYFNGAFSAKFSSWASNSFSGKGSLVVTKFDYIGFWQDLVLNPATANPRDHIVTFQPMTIKVKGVKTSDSLAAFTPPDFTASLPVINP